MDSCIFRTRFKELRKDAGLRYEDIAKKTGIGLETIRSHCRTGSNMPQLDYLELYSKLFDVDIAYLLGEQDCKRHANQSICDVTHLSEDAAGVLRELPELYAKNLSKIITHKDFNYFLQYFTEYLLFNEDAINASEGEPIEPGLESMLARGDKNINYWQRPDKFFIESITKQQISDMLTDIYNSRTTKEKNIQSIVIALAIYRALCQLADDFKHTENTEKAMIPDYIGFHLRHLNDVCRTLDYDIPKWTAEDVLNNVSSFKLFEKQFSANFSIYFKYLCPTDFYVYADGFNIEIENIEE